MSVEGVRMSRFLFIVLTFLFSSGHSQECQTVADGGRLFILPNSSICVNCPFMNVEWSINLNSLDNNVSTIEHTIFPNNSLLIRRSVEGSYQCGREIPNIHQFDVVFATTTLPYINDPTVYNETDSVTLTCEHDARPSPRAIMWQRNNVTVSSVPQLTINSIQQSDAGIYTCCIVRLLAGEFVPTCNDFTITVQYSPTISSLSPIDGDGMVPVNDHYIIRCVFEGLPIPTVVWSHDGNVLSNESNDITIATGDTSSTLTVTTVTAGDSGSYSCMVSNLLGSDMESSTLLVQLPPNPPSEVMVTAMTTQLSLSWTNAFDGHSPITMVMITYEQQAGSNTTVNADTITLHTITGLMPNMEYIISLQSFNKIGASGLVSVTTMTKPLPPSAPTVMLTAETSTSIRVSWSVMITSNMTAVTNWTLDYHPTSNSNDVTREIFDAVHTGYVLTGLNRGTSYTVQVAANNSIGMSSFTNQMESTLVDLPSEPTNLTAVALSHSRVRVTWAPVSDNGGAVVDLYKLVVTGPGLSSSNAPEFPPNISEYAIGGLTNNTIYIIHLSARNSRGFGPNATFTVETLDIGVPPPITPMESGSSDVSITVTWDMPMDIDIDHYQIEYRVKVDQSDWVAVMVNGTLTSYEIMGLSPLTTYEVRIFAISTEGVSSVAADAISIATDQPPVVIVGETTVVVGGRLELRCLLNRSGNNDNDNLPYNPQWKKGSGSLPDHVTVGGTNGHIITISSVNSSDSGMYTCTNGGSSDTVTVTVNNAVQQSDDGLDTLEYILIGIGGAILLGILILFICICCVCYIRRRRPKIYSPSKGSNWIDGDGHTGIVFMASSYSSSQSPSQREDTTDAPYLMGCKEDEFHNTSTFNTLERSAIHSYQQSDPPQDSNSANKSHRAHYAELNLPPSSKYVPPSTNSVEYSRIDKSSFKQKRSLSPPHTKAVPVPVETPTAAAAKKQYDNPTYMSSSYHYPVTPGDTVV